MKFCIYFIKQNAFAKSGSQSFKRRRERQRARLFGPKRNRTQAVLLGVDYQVEILGQNLQLSDEIRVVLASSSEAVPSITLTPAEPSIRP